MAKFMAEDGSGMSLFLLLFLNNILYVASLIGLIILLSLDSKTTVNRYGPPTI